MTEPYTPQEILSLPMEDNDADASTIGQYFTALLQTLWIDKENFSGKRPFGNSAWEYEIYKALIKADAVWGQLDEEGDIHDCDDAAADAIITSVLTFLHTADWKTVQEYREPEDWYVILLDRNGIGNPVLTDSFAIGFTEKMARQKVAERNLTSHNGVWTAIRIPK